MSEEKTQEVCCPRVDPDNWQDKIFNWNDKKFIKGKVFTLMYMPLNFGGVISRLMKKVGVAGAKLPIICV